MDYSAHFAEQRFDDYTTEDHAVWREVLARNQFLIQRYAHRMHPMYVEGRRSLQLPDHVPRIEELNERLAGTGWRTVCVDGYIPTSAYVGLMASRIFPVSRSVRRFEHIDFAPAPDLVHDVLGHLPMLFCAEYRDYLRRIASMMSWATPNSLDEEFYEAVREMADLKSSRSAERGDIARAEARVKRVNEALLGNSSELTHARRLYVWSVEFGLLGEPEAFLIHGAALLSSPREFRSASELDKTRVLPYSLDVISSENAFSSVLEQYFVARDFIHLGEVVDEYERRLQAREAPVRASEIREIGSGAVVRRGTGHA